MNAPSAIASKSEDFQQSGSFLVRLAERMGLASKAQNVFGEPVTHGDVTVVPVAKIRWGFGGGQSHGNAESERLDGAGDMVGAGGGGGVIATPMGYIEITKGGSRYRPIPDPIIAVPLAIAGGLAAALLLRSVIKTLRS